MIEIKITVDTAAEALAALNELALSASLPTIPKLDPPAVNTHPAYEAEIALLSTKASTAGSVEQAQEAPEQSEAPSPQDPPERTYTIEQIRAAGVKAADTHGKEAVKVLLKGMGVSGMTQLTKEQYPEFMRKLGELDAR